MGDLDAIRQRHNRVKAEERYGMVWDGHEEGREAHEDRGLLLAEVDRLRSEILDCKETGDIKNDLIAALRDENARLRAALEKIVALGDGPGAFDSRYAAIAKRGLGIEQ